MRRVLASTLQLRPRRLFSRTTSRPVASLHHKRFLWVDGELHTPALPFQATDVSFTPAEGQRPLVTLLAIDHRRQNSTISAPRMSSAIFAAVRPLRSLDSTW